MATPIREVDQGLEARLEALGMELVDLEWAGSDGRPVIRLRVDVRGSPPEARVTVGDCARVSRVLERWLDELPSLPGRYVLEVSSPGVERPLRRKRDYQRFLGKEAKIKRGGGGGSVTGVIEGVEGEDSEYRVLLRLPDGSLARIGDGEIARANLVFRWEEES